MSASTPLTTNGNWMDNLGAAQEKIIRLETENAHLWGQNSILRFENQQLIELLQRLQGLLSRNVKPAVDMSITEIRTRLAGRSVIK